VSNKRANNLECWELKKWVLNRVERKTIGNGLRRQPTKVFVV